MISRDILYLIIDTLLDIVVKKNFLLPCVGWYLFRLMSGNRYVTRSMQGLSVPFACVGSGHPVRILRLYTTNTLDIL